MYRLRDLDGFAIYNIYDFVLAIVGISLILFAITGAILWISQLKHDKIAWTMFVLRFAYVSTTIGYLILY